jgi:hypothetical protein
VTIAANVSEERQLAAVFCRTSTKPDVIVRYVSERHVCVPE